MLLSAGASTALSLLSGCIRTRDEGVPRRRAGSYPRVLEGPGGRSGPSPRPDASVPVDASRPAPQVPSVGFDAGRPTAPGAIDAALDVDAAPEAAAPAHVELVPDPLGVLDLLPGFTYRVLQRSGETMSDGYQVPGRPDAMGCFEGPPGQIILMRNHEIFEGDTLRSPYFAGQAAPLEAYDPQGTGGVTRLVIDADSFDVVSSNLVLAGTYWNCAGGLSPWGWLSCEETLSTGHGYVFLCPVDSPNVSVAQPIPGYGRMRHEAAAVHAGSSIAYLTEDRADGCFYRFVPDDPALPFAGRLQALRIAGRPGFDTGTLRPGERLAVDWVDLDLPPAEDDSLRFAAQVKGAARVVRGEGLWLTAREVYFCASSGGRFARGQVLRLSFEPDAALEVVAESDGVDGLDMPDNLCVSPHGELYVAEDSGKDGFIRRIGLDGSIVPFARNALSSSELAGLCFSPDGRTLFANVQSDGITLAIHGPFERELALALPRLGGLHAGLALLAGALFIRGRRDPRPR